MGAGVVGRAVLVRVLGPLEVSGAGGPVAVAGHSQRTVLALLALHAGRPVGVAALMDALWPEGPPPAARNSLQSHVARLRAALGAPRAISLEPAGYRLAVERSAVDALRFEDLLGDDATVEEALGLWRGEPLPEFPGEPFRGVAARLREMYREGLARCLAAGVGLARADGGGAGEGSAGGGAGGASAGGAGGTGVRGSGAGDAGGAGAGGKDAGGAGERGAAAGGACGAGAGDKGGGDVRGRLVAEVRGDPCWERGACVLAEA